MLLFSVTSIRENPVLAANIVREYAFNHLTFASNVWFVADKGVTTAEVCEKIGVKSGGIPDVIVVKIESYFGLANSNIWEWFKVKAASP